MVQAGAADLAAPAAPAAADDEPTTGFEDLPEDLQLMIAGQARASWAASARVHKAICYKMTFFYVPGSLHLFHCSHSLASVPAGLQIV